MTHLGQERTVGFKIPPDLHLILIAGHEEPGNACTPHKVQTDLMKGGGKWRTNCFVKEGSRGCDVLGCKHEACRRHPQRHLLRDLIWHFERRAELLLGMGEWNHGNILNVEGLHVYMLLDLMYRANIMMYLSVDNDTMMGRAWQHRGKPTKWYALNYDRKRLDFYERLSKKN